MAHFYGTVQGSRGMVTRTGGKGGLTTQAAGWGGAIHTAIFQKDGRDYYRVTLTPWKNSGGTHRVIAEGWLEA